MVLPAVVRGNDGLVSPPRTTPASRLSLQGKQQAGKPPGRVMAEPLALRRGILRTIPMKEALG